MYRFILFLKLKGILCEIFRFGGSQIPLVLAGRENYFLFPVIASLDSRSSVVNSSVNKKAKTRGR